MTFCFVLAGRFLPAFVGLMSGLPEFTARGGGGFFGFDSDFVSRFPGLSSGRVGVRVALTL